MRYPLILALGLAACSQGDSSLDPVRLKLSDPDTAKFEAVAQGDGVTCGLVNAKNKLGGYVGFRAFVIKSGRADIEGELGQFAARVPSECPKEVALAYIDLLGGQVGTYDAILDGSLRVGEDD